MGDFDFGAIDGIHESGCLVFEIMGLEQEDPHAIGFEIKISVMGIGLGGEEEFHTAILPDLAVGFRGSRADKLVIHPEYQIEILLVVTHFHAGCRERVRGGPHVISQGKRRGLHPEWFGPIRIDDRRIVTGKHLVNRRAGSVLNRPPRTSLKREKSQAHITQPGHSARARDPKHDVRL